MNPRIFNVAVWSLVLAVVPGLHAQQDPPPPAFERTPGPKIVISGDVALASFMALSDGYLQKLADCYTLFASTAEARSADWNVIRTPLGAVAERNVSALVWFALPDGSYWSVQEGKSSGNLSDRDYFPRVLAGETVIGALVVSKATGKASAIVAVPVRGDGGVVVGVLGASVYLDELSGRLNHRSDRHSNRDKSGRAGGQSKSSRHGWDQAHTLCH